MNDDLQSPALPSDPPSKRPLYVIAVIAVALAVIPPVMYASHVGWAIVADPAAWNNFGTFVGGVLGPYLSTLAFFGLLYTVYLTQKQVGMAREALAGTRDQTVNAAFFEMVTLHNQIVAGITFKQQTGGGMAGIEPSYTTYEGRKALQFLYKVVFLPKYNDETKINDQRGPNKMGLPQFDRWIFDNINEDFADDLGHYFRNLYRILKFVNESGLDEKGKRTLSGILRAQLSNSELGLIFYNGKSRLGEERLKPLIEEFSMLQNMTPKMCINRESARDYKTKAFGNAKDRFFTDQGIPEPENPTTA